jgi:flagellar biosynthesis/type III secretory pathway M-ring protein FliF/YscJ
MLTAAETSSNVGTPLSVAIIGATAVLVVGVLNFLIQRRSLRQQREQPQQQLREQRELLQGQLKEQRQQSESQLKETRRQLDIAREGQITERFTGLLNI